MSNGSASGNLYGRVTDHEGRPLPCATVVLSGPGDPQERATDARGDFRFLGQAPGDYSTETALEGFKTAVNQPINIRIGGNTAIEVRMSPAVKPS